MADANIRAVITAKDDASRVLDNFTKNGSDSFLKMGAVVGAVSGIVESVATRAFDALGQSLQTAVKRVDTLDNAQRTFENMGFKAEDTAKSMDLLKKSVLGLPTPLDSAVRNMELLSSATNDIGKSQKIFTALNDGIIGFGGTADQVNTAVIQLSQAFAGGRVMAQDWNSMLNAGLGPALNAISREMGITQRDLKEGLSDGTISVGKFQDALIKLDEKGGGGLKSLQKIAKDSSKGIGTGIENMKTAIARGMANVLKAIGTEKISDAISSIGAFFENNANKVIQFIDALKKLGPSLTEVASKVGDYLGPKLRALWNTIKDELIPTLSKLWHEVIEPITPVIGTLLVGAIGLAIDAWKLFLEILTPVINYMIDHEWIFWSIVGVLGALKLAFALQGAIAAFQGVMDAVILSYGTFTALLASPLVLPAIAIGAALIALWKIKDAAIEAWNAVQQAKGANESLTQSNIQIIKKLQEQSKAPYSPEIIARSKATLAKLQADGQFNQQLASGTNYAMGGATLVGEQGPEIVNMPRGASVTPNNKIGGANINVTFQGIFTGSEMEFRKLAVKMFNAYDDAKGMGTI